MIPKELFISDGEESSVFVRSEARTSSFRRDADDVIRFASDKALFNELENRIVQQQALGKRLEWRTGDGVYRFVKE